MKEKPVICPQCKSSEEVQRLKYSSAFFAISVLFLGFPLFIKSKTYHCYNCHIQFR